MTPTDKPMELNPEILCGIDAFRQLTPADRKALVSHCKWRRYAADQRIISYHDTTKDVYFIISGRVQAISYSLSGKQVIFQDLEAGQMFGELSAIDGEPRSAHVIALTDCLIASLSPNDFWEALKNYPVVAEMTLKRLTGMVRLLVERFFELNALPVRDRVHTELLRLCLQQESSENTVVISPAPTHADIASHIGTHREAVTRELRRLKNAGLITRQSGDLVICDVAQLTQIVREVVGD